MAIRLISVSPFLFIMNISPYKKVCLDKEGTKMKKFKTLSVEEKLTVQLFLGCIIAIAGLVLLFVSFFVNPLGVIHSSVLAAVGEVFTFSGALIGIDYTYKYKMYQRLKHDDNEEE